MQQTTGGLDLYQSFFGDFQRQFVSPVATPYDVTGNTGNDQREYDLFKKIHSTREAGSGPWGLVSWKFEHKSLVTIERFHAFAIERFAAGDQCVFLNPMIGNAAMHQMYAIWQMDDPAELLLSDEFRPAAASGLAPGTRPAVSLS